MGSIKNEALAAISSMPDDTSADEIMYQIYVLDKIKKGQDAVTLGKTMSIEEIEKEIHSW